MKNGDQQRPETMAEILARLARKSAFKAKAVAATSESDEAAADLPNDILDRRDAALAIERGDRAAKTPAAEQRRDPAFERLMEAKRKPTFEQMIAEAQAAAALQPERPRNRDRGHSRDREL